MKSRLLSWYRVQRRDLPWRSTRDPYRLWISEVMLQQTRVERVVEYYERFLRRFPHLFSLATAPEEEVLAAWSGLGYYRRARLLHEAAKLLATAGGIFPRTVERLRELPGIGEYTAAAIASMAFDMPEPAVDGNAARVISRLVCFDGDPGSSEGKRHLAQQAASLLDPEAPGDSNQAIMELGSRVCTPKAPRCEECPLSQGCAALLAGEPERFPVRRRRRRRERRTWEVVVVEREGKMLLFRRPLGSALLGGTWELPWFEAAAPAVETLGTGLGHRYGGYWSVEKHVLQLRHAITYRDLVIEVYRGGWSCGGDVAERVEAGWFSRGERASLPMSSWVQKALAELS